MQKTIKILNDIAISEGKKIYLELREKYPKNNIEDLDIILNSLVYSLLCLAQKANDKKLFCELVLNILHKNI